MIYEGITLLYQWLLPLFLHKWKQIPPCQGSNIGLPSIQPKDSAPTTIKESIHTPYNIPQVVAYLRIKKICWLQTVISKPFDRLIKMTSGSGNPKGDKMTPGGCHCTNLKV